MPSKPWSQRARKPSPCRSIRPGTRGVARNLQLLFTHAALVDAFSLPDESEPAPVFRA